MQTTITIIDGSNQKTGATRKLARVLEAHLTALGVKVLFFDQKESSLPLFDDSDEGRAHPNVQELFSVVSKADAVVLSSPEYHGSMSSAMKNALDWLNYAKEGEIFEGKVVGLIGGGGSLANSGASLQMMMAVRSMHGWLMPDVLVSVRNIWNAFNPGGDLMQKEDQTRLAIFATKLGQYAEVFKANRQRLMAA